MIEDEELREIYKISCEEHIEKIEAGLLHLEKDPGDAACIEEILREAHSLKGDSRISDVESVESIAHVMEDILGSVKREETELTAELSDRLYQALDAMKKLVREAVTDEPSGVDSDAIVQMLQGQQTDEFDLGFDIFSEENTSEEIALDLDWEETPESKDEFQTATEEHVNRIEEGLLYLEQHQEDEEYIGQLIDEAHSLTEEAKTAGLQPVENVAHAVEDVLGSVKRHETSLTPNISDRLYQGLDAISKLVEEAVTDTPSEINAQQVVQQLEDVIPEEPEKTEAEQLLELGNISALNATTQTLTVTPQTLTPPEFIEDPELRELYQVSGKERVTHLETALLALEANPDDADKIDELLGELHSLKGDSRIIGVECVEKLAFALEEVLRSIKNGQTELNHSTGDRIHQTLKALGKLVEQAVTGIPSNVDPQQVFNQLVQGETSDPEKQESTMTKPTIDIKETPAAAPITPVKGKAAPLAKKKPSQPPVKTTSESTPTVAGEPYHIDTIRVQTRHLDALMTQTGELTVTKIRIAHFASEAEELASLWEDWRTNYLQKRAYSQEEVNAIEERIERIISQIRSGASENSTRLDLISGELEEKIRTLRLLPLSNVFHFFPRMVRDLAKQEAKEVELILEGGETAADKQILEEIKDPLMHLIRNAIDHGIETPEERERAGKPRVGKIWLRGYQTATNILIEVQDDGMGLDIQRIKDTAIRKGLVRTEELANMTTTQIQSLIFLPGFSTRTFITEVSGRGVGMDVVRTNVERLKGSIQIESTPGKGSIFRIQLGTTLATANVLLVDVGGIVHALPIEFVETTLLVEQNEIFTIEGRSTIALDGQAVSVVHLADLLEIPSLSSSVDKTNKQLLPCALLKIGDERFGLFVDNVLDTQDVVIKPQSKLLKRVRNVTGATILGTGEVCMILNPQDLLKSLQKTRGAITTTAVAETQKSKSKLVVLLAEDSIATRTQEKRILEAAGYEVVTAVDGLEAYNKLRTRPFDAIVSDVQMPNMDGLTFTTKIRQTPEYSELPIILVTTLASDEDKRKGAEAGANAYIVKGKFNQDMLLDTLKRLI